MHIINDLTYEQIKEIKQIIKKMKEDDERDKIKTKLDFTYKYTTEEMMMKVAMSYK